MRKNNLISLLMIPILAILSGCTYRDQIPINDPFAPSCSCETEKEKIKANYRLIGFDYVVEITDKKLNQTTTYIGFSPSYPSFVKHPNQEREKIPYRMVAQGTPLRKYFVKKGNCKCEE